MTMTAREDGSQSRSRKPGENRSAVAAGVVSAYMVLGVVGLIALTALVAVAAGMGS